MKYIFLTGGFVFLTLGAVGSFLPVLPTTPFLLLASVCFAKGSVKFNNWFCRTKLYKKHIESLINERSMTLKAKITILTIATLMLCAAFFLMDNIIGRIAVILIIIIKYYYFIFKIKTVSKKELPQK